MVYKPCPRANVAAAPSLVPALEPAADEGLLRSCSAKRLKPGDPGTKRLLERYGAKLLCVRYRIDPDTGRRFTTVELVVNERTGPSPTELWVRLDYSEAELRQRVKEAGGIWDSRRKLWRISAKAAKALGLQKRIVKDIQ